MSYRFENNGALRAMTAEELVAADSHSAVIELDQGVLEDGRPYWAYIAVKPSKYREFKRVAAARQPRRLTDYGRILKYGLESQVPDSVREEMKREHGCDENFLNSLAADVKKAQAKHEESRIGDIVAMLKKKG